MSLIKKWDKTKPRNEAPNVTIDVKKLWDEEYEGNEKFWDECWDNEEHELIKKWNKTKPQNETPNVTIDMKKLWDDEYYI